MRFQIQSDYTRDEYRNLYRVALKTRYRSIRNIMYATIVVVVLLLAFSFWTLLRGGGRIHLVVSVLFMLLVLLYPLIIMRSAEGKGWQSYQNTFGHPTLILDEDGLEKITESGSQRFAYADVTGIYRGGGMYLLMMKNSRGYILPERCFAEGDPAAFGPFVEQKCGLPVKAIK